MNKKTENIIDYVINILLVSVILYWTAENFDITEIKTILLFWMASTVTLLYKN